MSESEVDLQIICPPNFDFLCFAASTSLTHCVSTLDDYTFVILEILPGHCVHNEGVFDEYLRCTRVCQEDPFLCEPKPRISETTGGVQWHP